MISSQLKGQLFPKYVIWHILSGRQKVWGNNPVPQDLEVSVGDRFVGIYLPPSSFKYRFKASKLLFLADATLYFYLHLIAKYDLVRRSTTPQGFCTMISFWDFLDAFMMRSAVKSDRVSVQLVGQNIFAASSSQVSESEEGEEEPKNYTVAFSLWGGTCDCMLFRCLRNRIKKELPYYWQLMRESRYFAGQVVCHHIAACLNYQGFHTLADYLNSRKKSTA